MTLLGRRIHLLARQSGIVSGKYIQLGREKKKLIFRACASVYITRVFLGVAFRSHSHTHTYTHTPSLSLCLSLSLHPTSCSSTVFFSPCVLSPFLHIRISFFGVPSDSVSVPFLTASTHLFSLSVAFSTSRFCPLQTHLSHSYSPRLLSFLRVYIFSTTHFPCLDFFYIPVELQHRSLSYNHLWVFSLVVRTVFLFVRNTTSHCRYCFLLRVTLFLFRTVFLVACNTMSFPYCVSCTHHDVSLSALCFLLRVTRCLFRTVFLAHNTMSLCPYCVSCCV